jgi:hypothetical protein
MFAGVADVRPEFLATSLAHDALALGARQVEIHHADHWWAVASSEDWIAYHNNCSVRETFRRILPVPGIVNACRSEVVVHALAGAVFTSKSGELTILSGDEAAIRRLLAHDPFCRLGEKRFVAFAMLQSSAPERD